MPTDFEYIVNSQIHWSFFVRHLSAPLSIMHWFLKTAAREDGKKKTMGKTVKTISVRWMSFCYWRRALNRITIFIWCIHWISSLSLTGLSSLFGWSQPSIRLTFKRMKHRYQLCVTTYALKVHSWIFISIRQSNETVSIQTFHEQWIRFAYENCILHSNRRIERNMDIFLVIGRNIFDGFDGTFSMNST